MTTPGELFQDPEKDKLIVSKPCIRAYKGQFMCKLYYWFESAPKEKYNASLFGKTKEEVQIKVDQFLAQTKK